MQQGLFGKYILSKSDGRDIDSSAKYFVLRYDADSADGEAARAALRVYCDCIREYSPKLAFDLLQEIQVEGLAKRIGKKNKP